MKYVCLQTEDWTGEVLQPYRFMYPLKIDAPHNMDTFSNIGIHFESVETNPLYKDPLNSTYFSGKTIMPECKHVELHFKRYILTHCHVGYWHEFNPAHFIFPIVRETYIDMFYTTRLNLFLSIITRVHSSSGV